MTRTTHDAVRFITIKTRGAPLIETTPHRVGDVKKASSAKKHCWLDTGEEQCPTCLQAYLYEQEVRCIHCDEPMCPMCVVRVRARIRAKNELLMLCPHCADGAQDETQHEHQRET